MPTEDSTSYGASGHYQGAAGEVYFASQRRGADVGGKISAGTFLPYVTEQDAVLDFGCGGGWILKHLRARRKVGVELNPAAHEEARKNGVDVYATLDAVPHGDTFSRIITHHVLEHVPYPIEALRQLRNRLTPDGKLVIVVPIDDWRMQKDATGSDIDHHLHTWTPRLMANTLTEAGLKPQQVRVLTHAWPPAYPMLHRHLPAPIFHLSCRIWAILRRRRQLLAVAGR